MARASLLYTFLLCRTVVFRNLLHKQSRQQVSRGVLGEKDVIICDILQANRYCFTDGIRKIHCKKSHQREEVDSSGI